MKLLVNESCTTQNSFTFSFRIFSRFCSLYLKFLFLFCDISVCAVNGVSTSVIVPTTTLRNSIPLRHCTIKMDFFKFPTSCERRITYRSYAIRNYYTRKFLAIKECLFPYRCYTFADRYALTLVRLLQPWNA